MGRSVGELLPATRRSSRNSVSAALCDPPTPRQVITPNGFARVPLAPPLVDNFSVKSHDLLLTDGRRVQVKTRVTSEPPKAGQLQTSPFRSWDFDLAAFVLLRDYDYAVRRGGPPPRGSGSSPVDLSQPCERISSVVMMRGALLDHGDAEDITDRLRAAAGQV